MDIVALSLSVLLIALGGLTLLTAWLHKSPGASLISRFSSWPKEYQDRTQLALSGAIALGLGILVALDFKETNLAVLLALVVVVCGMGIAAGLRSTAV